MHTYTRAWMHTCPRAHVHTCTHAHRCGLSFEELCRYKYLLNVGSNGYANKLKYLFLTGSVVIWVRKDSLNYEFFEGHFIPGIHYASVDTVEDVPDMIRRLQADPAWAESMARAGQAQMASLDTDEVAHYCYQMLKAYAGLQHFVPKRDPRSWEVNCEDDMVRATTTPTPTPTPNPNLVDACMRTYRCATMTAGRCCRSSTSSRTTRPASAPPSQMSI